MWWGVGAEARLGVHLHRVLIADAVLTQEVELDLGLVALNALDVLNLAAQAHKRVSTSARLLHVLSPPIHRFNWSHERQNAPYL